ncbi:MAG: transcription elongation factor GreA [Holosporales bacterium]|jgi:transcription elongation factor GreA|nr:transcription elongation factor GreA [Holosporales bacterium]
MMDLENGVPITAAGFEKLKDELKRLKEVERLEIVEDIAEARSHGDLSENAEYHAAKERQSFIEGKISELEEKINQAQIIDISQISGNEIKFGATITLRNLINNNIAKYQIVGSYEADVKQGLLSITSPLARALIGKKVDNEVDVTIPSGTHSYVIEKVEYI